jgi:hypothetical protein
MRSAATALASRSVAGPESHNLVGCLVKSLDRISVRQGRRRRTVVTLDAGVTMRSESGAGTPAVSIGRGN